MVLVLVLDYVSAPFHHHVHEGFAVQLAFDAARHDALHADGVNPDASDHADTEKHAVLSHATAALRHEPSKVPDLLVAFPVAVDAAWALVSAVARLSPPTDVSPTQWRPDRSLADIPFHHSLPPAGRAPPLHAA